MKKQKGITLIALVITIIVLLILAGVSISMVIGNNGILNQASTAAIDTKNTSEKEKVELAYLAARSRELAGETEKTIEELLEEELGKLGVEAEATSNLVTKTGDVLTVAPSSGNSYSIKNEVVTPSYSEGTGNTTPEGDYSYLFDFDETTGTINGIKAEYIGAKEGKGENISYYKATTNADYGYFMENGSSWEYGWCIINKNIDTLIVPSEINGVPVKTVKKLGVVNVRKIVFEEGIETINHVCTWTDAMNSANYSGVKAEYNKLKEVVFPATLKSLNGMAIRACVSIEKVYFESTTDLPSTNFGFSRSEWGGSNYESNLGITYFFRNAEVASKYNVYGSHIKSTDYNW